jgi:hypothetical protein
LFFAPHLQRCRYLQLEHEDFLSQVQPRPLLRPELFHLNLPLAEELGLTAEDFSPERFADSLGEPGLPESIVALATAYSGHQFGQFNPALGDGRAMLVGELSDQTGERWEMQLKGSGPTPYSRGFDGRAVMRSVIREYLASEAMAALRIPTTRALCIVNSQTPVFREQTEAAALMIRCAPSHLRFGSFEHFFARRQIEHLQQLADFCIAEYFPELLAQPEPYAAWFAEVVRRTARLMAQWQSVGFCHGVMNTDNFSILGLTLDYGPYGFLERYEPGHICNHSDTQGRYAFDRQPGIGYWNCLCLARALSPLIDQVHLEQCLSQYETELQQAYLRLMRGKLGLLCSADDEADEALISQLMTLLEHQHLDYSRFFRGLGYWLEGREHQDWLFQSCESYAVTHWLELYRARLRNLNDGLPDVHRGQRMGMCNPKYVLRNHLAQDAIEQANLGNADELERLLGLLREPFDEHPGFEEYASPPPVGAEEISVSCSS